MAEAIRLCGPATNPPAKGRECAEAVYSQGRHCKRCDRSDCYRQGWEKWRVDADNKERTNATVR
jgi:hypothetical protein